MSQEKPIYLNLDEDSSEEESSDEEESTSKPTPTGRGKGVAKMCKTCGGPSKGHKRDGRGKFYHTKKELKRLKRKNMVLGKKKKTNRKRKRKPKPKSKSPSTSSRDSEMIMIKDFGIENSDTTESQQIQLIPPQIQILQDKIREQESDPIPFISSSEIIRFSTPSPTTPSPTTPNAFNEFRPPLNLDIEDRGRIIPPLNPGIEDRDLVEEEEAGKHRRDREEEVIEDYQRSDKAQKTRRIQKGIESYEEMVKRISGHFGEIEKTCNDMEATLKENDFGGYYNNSGGDANDNMIQGIQKFKKSKDELMKKVNEQFKKFKAHNEKNQCGVCFNHVENGYNTFTSYCKCTELVCVECAIGIASKKGGYVCPFCNRKIF